MCVDCCHVGRQSTSLGRSHLYLSTSDIDHLDELPADLSLQAHDGQAAQDKGGTHYGRSAQSRRVRQ